MGFFKFVLWTGCAVALGVGLASWELDGRTPLEHAEREWKQSGGSKKAKSLANGVGEQVGDAYESAKVKLGANNPGAPNERYSDEDRAEVNALLSQYGKKK